MSRRASRPPAVQGQVAQDWRLLTYLAPEGAARAGLLVDGQVHDVARCLGPDDAEGADRSSVLALLQRWDTSRTALASLAERCATGDDELSTHGRPLASTRLAAPVPQPGAIYCAGANYVDHSAEMAAGGRDRPAPQDPYFFLKASACVAAPDEPVCAPAGARQLDWEVELAVVLGRPARAVPVDEALSYVAGYTILNDLSLRDRSRRTDWHWSVDWLSSKSFDASAPMGPWLTPAQLVPDVQDLMLELWVDDTRMQHASTAGMRFSVAEQIAYLSRQLTLRPGDVIATGTPAGVGRPRGIFLQPGQTVRAAITGLGELRNPVSAGHRAPAADQQDQDDGRRG